MSYINEHKVMEPQKGKNGGAFVILVDAEGVPYVASGGGGGGGGTDITPLIQRIGELVAAPDALTQLGRLKAMADLLTTLDTDLVSRIGEVTANPAANTLLARLVTLNTTLSTINTNVKVPQFSTVTIVNAATPAAGGAAFTQFGALNCTGLDITNDTGVDIEYRRNGGGNTYPILAGTSRLIVGIANANQVSFRRIDQAAVAVSVKAEGFAA